MGINGMAYLRAQPEEQVIYDGILRAGEKHLLNLQKRQAGLIASEVAKLFKK